MTIAYWVCMMRVPAAQPAAAAVPPAAAAPSPWPVERARDWQASRPWVVGCNFLPSTAVNDVELWQRETSDPEAIDRELGWAQGLGLNSVRVFVNYVVWQDDAAGLKQRFGQFLTIADRHGLSVMPVLFDDCAFAGKEPHLGTQDAPVPGVHNSGWVPSPGLKRVTDRATWPSLERYLKDLVGTFGSDRRVVVWDLYNELGRPVLCTEWLHRQSSNTVAAILPLLAREHVGCYNWGLVAGRTQTFMPWGSNPGDPVPALWQHDLFYADGTPFDPAECDVFRACVAAAAK